VGWGVGGGRWGKYGEGMQQGVDGHIEVDPRVEQTVDELTEIRSPRSVPYPTLIVHIPMPMKQGGNEWILEVARRWRTRNSSGTPSTSAARITVTLIERKKKPIESHSRMRMNWIPVSPKHWGLGGG
jgi:hypothetical protein